MQYRKLLPLLVVLASFAVAAPASAAFKVGIGDQKETMFDHPSFQALNVDEIRYLVPWDWNKRAYQRAETDAFLKRAEAANANVFVTFTATRGCWANNRYSKRKICRAPSTRAYRSSFKAFRKKYPQVKTFAPWNEVNHRSQPTFRKPHLAARYYNVVRANCRGCKIVAADVLDQSDVVRYLESFRRYAKGSPKLWGLHNYGDVNRKRTTMTRKVLRAVPGQVWLTETGGIVKLEPSFKYSPRRAAYRTRYMFSLVNKYDTRRSGMRSKITRVYVYQWTGVAKSERFDAGLVSDTGKLRPAYSVFKKYSKGKT